MNNRKDCPMRHENGNCLPADGFCTAVNDSICEALHNAYRHGESEERDRLVLSMIDANTKYQEQGLEILRNIQKRVSEDTVPVVRCKDCEHGIWDEENEMWKCVESADYDEQTGDWLGFCEYHNEDFYCAYGERKDNEQA